MNPNNNTEQTESALDKSSETRAAEIVDDSFAFAEGLPEWSLEPPVISIRRRRRI